MNKFVYNKPQGKHERRHQILDMEANALNVTVDQLRPNPATDVEPMKDKKIMDGTERTEMTSCEEEEATSTVAVHLIGENKIAEEEVRDVCKKILPKEEDGGDQEEDDEDDVSNIFSSLHQHFEEIEKEKRTNAAIPNKDGLSQSETAKSSDVIIGDDSISHSMSIFSERARNVGRASHGWLTSMLGK